MVTRQQMREAAAAFGKEGGKKRARRMTAEQRKESARKAAKARWAKEGRTPEIPIEELRRVYDKTHPRA